MSHGLDGGNEKAEVPALPGPERRLMEQPEVAL